MTPEAFALDWIARHPYLTSRAVVEGCCCAESVRAARAAAAMGLPVRLIRWRVAPTGDYCEHWAVLLGRWPSRLVFDPTAAQIVGLGRPCKLRRLADYPRNYRRPVVFPLDFFDGMPFPLDFDSLPPRVDAYTEAADARTAAASVALRFSALLLVLLPSLLALGR